MTNPTKPVQLQMLGRNEYVGVNELDPIRYYRWPVLGAMYRRRVELCLEQCTGGDRILEIGFGTGLSFLNLSTMYREIHGLDLTADAALVQKNFEARNVTTHLQQGDVLKMPYEDNFFDTVLLISILEHLKPEQQPQAFAEMRRVLKPGGQVVYGVPIERPFMVFMFKLLGHDIRKEHFSTQTDVEKAASGALQKVSVTQMHGRPGLFGAVYEVGHFRKA